MEEGSLKKQRALSDILSDAPNGWPDQSITLREKNALPSPLLLHLHCFCLLRMFWLFVVVFAFWIIWRFCWC